MTKEIHKHFFATFLAVGFALFFGLVVYPKIAYNRGEEGTPNAPTDFSGTAGVESVELTWTASRAPEEDPVISYVIYYIIGDSRDEISVDTSGPVTEYVIEGLEAEVPHTFYVVAYNSAGESLESDSISITPTISESGEPIAISVNPTVSATSTTATIRWGTNIVASSKVYYGPLDNFYDESSEYNTDEGVMSHSVLLTNLIPCSRYWYKAFSYDADRNPVESAGGEFTTAGCKGGASIIDSDTKKVTTSSGASLEASSSGRTISVSAPAAIKSGISELAISALKLEAESVKTELPAPIGKVLAESQIYSLTAFEDSTTEFDGQFDLPVSITIDYTKDDVSNINIDTLKIWHYEESDGWEELSSCINNYDKETETGTITCQTQSFSIFTLAGQEEQSNITSSGSLPTLDSEIILANSGGGGSSSGSSSNNETVSESADANEEVNEMQNVQPVSLDEENLKEETEEENLNNNNFKITKNLAYGIIDEEVLILQKFLNQIGILLDISGAGSPGNETNYFGPKTKNALIRFQEMYANNILAPYGLTKGTGYLGEKTKEFINSFKQ